MMLREGELAPDFTIGEWSLAEARKKGPVLLAFFKISCPTCQLTFPFLQRLAGALQIAPVSQDDSIGTEQFRRRFGISMPAILDPGPAYKASNLYGIRSVPSLFLIEPDGVISMCISGFSKEHLAHLGERFQAPIFLPGEEIPTLRPG
jgi:peroxiredoxin